MDPPSRSTRDGVAIAKADYAARDALRARRSGSAQKDGHGLERFRSPGGRSLAYTNTEGSHVLDLEDLAELGALHDRNLDYAAVGVPRSHRPSVYLTTSRE